MPSNIPDQLKHIILISNDLKLSKRFTNNADEQERLSTLVTFVKRRLQSNSIFKTTAPI